MRTANPYAAPKAAVADASVVVNADFVPGGQSRPIAHGWSWIAEGWELFKRAAGNALLRRADAIVRLTSQYPSTTTAHVTTIHTGLPVGAHGVYEWILYEPSLGRLISPLLFSYAGDERRATLAGLPRWGLLRCDHVTLHVFVFFITHCSRPRRIMRRPEANVLAG
jgi:hypothetical protein